MAEMELTLLDNEIKHVLSAYSTYQPMLQLPISQTPLHVCTYTHTCTTHEDITIKYT